MNGPVESKPLARLSWFTLGWNLLVILWGAVVRATGSGAGCGAHWPTCNGSVVPLAPSVGTLIEYSHRLTSGVALILVALVLYQVRRHREPGHLARFWSAASMILILTEAAVGAGLVLFERVAGDTSVARGYWISGHLINTFLLLAALVLTARFVDGPPRPFASRVSPLRATFPAAGGGGATILAVLAMVLTGMSGAIAALGDTLFKAETLREAIAQDFSSASHIFLRLRILHPVIAVIGGGVVLMVAYRTIMANPNRPGTRRLGLVLAALVVTQWFLGVLNLVLLAPTWLQIVHLLVADLIWMSLVLAAADASS
ncbi:MAG: COX15/CtaA family protein [Vicinamibacteria bacterium]|nr:COX15/CtaA family protein [Vicinamibacteria bacterium]